MISFSMTDVWGREAVGSDPVGSNGSSDDESFCRVAPS